MISKDCTCKKKGGKGLGGIEYIVDASILRHKGYIKSAGKTD